MNNVIIKNDVKIENMIYKIKIITVRPLSKI